MLSIVYFNRLMDIIFVLVCYVFEIQCPIVNTFADLEITVFGGQFGSFL